MNWGLKIILSFAVFMTGMIGMVVYVFNLQMDLVEENYYEKEIKYQQEIDVLTDTRNLEKGLEIQRLGGSLLFKFPEHESVPGGEIKFYRPSDASRDFTLGIAANRDGMQMVETSRLAKGSWKVQVTWYADNKKFFKEERLYID